MAASTCSALSVGYSARTAAVDSPAARLSSTTDTGMRVPRKHTAPCITCTSEAMYGIQSMSISAPLPVDVGHLTLARSLLDGPRHARHVVLDEERIDERHRQRAEQRAGHQRAPVVHVAFDQLGDDAHRNRLDLRRRHERQRIDELVPRQREREDAGRDQPWY